MNTHETVIVVRSLVPKGVAQVDGRLVPGDRIIYVNDTSLAANTNLDTAVRTLKGAQFGPVRIGVAKPANDNKNLVVACSGTTLTLTTAPSADDSEPSQPHAEEVCVSSNRESASDTFAEGSSNFSDWKTDPGTVRLL